MKITGFAAKADAKRMTWRKKKKKTISFPVNYLYTEPRKSRAQHTHTRDNLGFNYLKYLVQKIKNFIFNTFSDNFKSQLIFNFLLVGRIFKL